MKRLMKVAKEYTELGLSVISTDALKQSLTDWAGFQERLPTPEELRWMFHHPYAHCIAVVTGTVSGNLEVIDIDTKYDLRGDLLERMIFEMEEFDEDLIKQLVIAQSRSGGYHLYYRCDEIGRNQYLARRPVTDYEKARHPKQKIKVLIETRARGGYIIVPPSAGYRFIQHDFTRIPKITTEQRELLLRSARLCNEVKESPVIKRQPKKRPAGELTPLDDYNHRGDIIELLKKHGWTVAGENKKRTWLKRPGDSDKRSSGSYNHEMGLFSVFSTSTEFEPGRGYLPYAVYAVLECDGDFKRAVKQLAALGYGHSSNYPTVKTKGHSV